MYNVKAGLFTYLTKSQKSEILHYVASFVKKNISKSCEEIIELYLEEEQYYIDIDSSRHPWIEDFIGQEQLVKDLNTYIKECLKKAELKEKQKPYIEKQKQLAKEQRKKAQEFKMSKEPPSKAQISYYKALCKKNKIDADQDFLQSASKLDFKNAINLLLNAKHDQNRNELLNKLNEIKCNKTH